MEKLGAEGAEGAIEREKMEITTNSGLRLVNFILNLSTKHKLKGKRFWIIFLLVLAAGCRTTRMVQKNHAAPAPPRYSIIYIIHGDSNYLYHTESGEPRQSDEHAMKEAKQTGRRAKHGEVFIFYQKPERKILWIFPKKDRSFLYYRNGKLIHTQHYSPHSKKKAFVTEAALYHKYSQRKPASAAPSIFLYIGHEIPVRPDYPYDLSRSDVPFDTNIFVQGVKSFLPENTRPFSLIVLSTCNNGTPAMVQKLTPYTHYILASPQNLHLSQINTERLSELLEHGNTIPQTADSMAQHTYNRLSGFLETAITLSVYNTHITRHYLPALAGKYEKHLRKVSPADLLDDNVSCADFSFFHIPQKDNGVKVWYKPPQFGKKRSDTTSYSGWGCKK